MSRLPSDDPPDDPAAEAHEAMLEKILEILTDPLTSTATRADLINAIIHESWQLGYNSGLMDEANAQAEGRHRAVLNWPETEEPPRK